MKIITKYTTKLVLILFGAILLNITPGQAASEKALSTPEKFIQDLGERAISSLTIGSKEQISQNFLKLLDEGFDIDYIAKFVMGINWKHFTDAQKSEFKEAFKKHLERTYSVHFKEYKDAKLKVKSSRKEKTFEIVESTIQGKGEPIPVQWKISDATGTYKIRDVVVEGVSMGNTLRNEFGATYHRVGGDPVSFIKKLKGNL